MKLEMNVFQIQITQYLVGGCAVSVAEYIKPPAIVDLTDKAVLFGIWIWDSFGWFSGVVYCVPIWGVQELVRKLNNKNKLTRAGSNRDTQENVE